MKVYIKYFTDGLTPIEKVSKGDWIDLRSAEDRELKAGEWGFLRLGVGMILPEGYEAHIAPLAFSFPTAPASWTIPSAGKRTNGACRYSLCGIR